MDRKQRRETRRKSERDENQNGDRPDEEPDANSKRSAKRRSGDAAATAGCVAWNLPRSPSVTRAGESMGRAAARGSSTDSDTRSSRYSGDGVARAAKSGRLKQAGSDSKIEQKARASAKTKSGKSSSSRKRRREKNRPPAQDRGASHGDEDTEDPVLAALIDRLRIYLSHEHPDRDPLDVPINATTARYLLEATSGNIELAATLYFESEAANERADAAARQARGSRAQRSQEGGNESNDSKGDAPLQRENVASGGGDPPGVAARAGGDQGDLDEEERRVRRRLERQFEDANLLGIGGQDAGAPAANEEQPGGDDNDDEPPAEANAVPDAEAAEVAADEDHGESVSVSDDEVAAGVAVGWRMVGDLAGQLDDDADEEVRARSNRATRRIQRAELRRARRAARQQAEQQIRNIARSDRLQRFVSENIVDTGDGSKKIKAPKETAQEDTDMDIDCMSEEDWFCESDTGSSGAEVPAELLWGSGPSGDNEANAEPGNGGRNVIAEENSSVEASRSSIGIPRTWINGGFTMSSCATGLVAKAPSEDELALLRLGQQQGQRGANGSTAPYHCRGVTLLLSVVTSLLYTGASIQGSEVNCSSAHKPFAELSDKERKQQFEPRLTDALSALLHIAAKASMERRKRFLERRGSLKKQNGSDSDTLREQMIRRRLRLCPTCRWDEEDATNEGRPPEGQDAGKRVRVNTSFSSIQDIRSYVLSNMRSFTGRGGCALFLETILRIHGKNCVKSMIRRARKKLSVKETSRRSVNSLVVCKCEEASKSQRLPSLSTDSNESNIDTVGLGHGCVGIELLSLVLTGQVHASLKGWSTGSLEVGILSNERGEVGKALSKSTKNVWILRGDTCYSVMWLDGSKENVACNYSLDKPGCSFHLSHWNCWYGQRNLSGLRVNTVHGDWIPPTQTKPSFDASPKKLSVTDAILARRRQQKANVVSSDEFDSADSNEEPAIAKKEIDRVVVHPDDTKYYPKQYRRWRFDLGSPWDSGDGTAGDNEREKHGDAKISAVPGKQGRKENWIPYYRLNSRQKLVVEMRLAPKINRILWTRWPGATIDSFTPVDGPPPVV